MFTLSEIRNAIQELDFMFTKEDTLRYKIEITLYELSDFHALSNNTSYMCCDKCDVMLHLDEDEHLIHTKVSGGYDEPETHDYYCVNCHSELSNDITFKQYIDYTYN